MHNRQLLKEHFQISDAVIDQMENIERQYLLAQKQVNQLLPYLSHLSDFIPLTVTPEVYKDDEQEQETIEVLSDTHDLFDESESKMSSKSKTKTGQGLSLGEALRMRRSNRRKRANHRRKSREVGLKSTDQGLHIGCNKAMKLSFDDLMFVYAHEAMHIYLKHGIRGEKLDKTRWAMASDHEVNVVLSKVNGLRIPTEAFLISPYKHLSAEGVYDRISMQDCQRYTQNKNTALQAEHSWEQERLELESNSDDLKALLAAKLAAKQQSEQMVRRRSKRYQHSIQRRRNSSKKQETLQDPSKARSYHTEQLEKALEKCVFNGSKASIDWRRLLARFMRQQVRLLSHRRFQRRFIGQGLYLPAMKKKGISLVIALDTSGSMTSLLPKFIAEIGYILQGADFERLTIIQCSAQITHVDQYRKHSIQQIKDLVPVGGGGTLFDPVFHYVDQELHHTPNLLIYLTDGFAPPVLASPPNYPVIWVLNHYNQNNKSLSVSFLKEQGVASFGICLSLQQENSKEEINQQEAC